MHESEIRLIQEKEAQPALGERILIAGRKQHQILGERARRWLSDEGYDAVRLQRLDSEIPTPHGITDILISLNPKLVLSFENTVFTESEVSDLQAPIIVLTTSTEVDRKIEFLESGAIDIHNITDKELDANLLKAKIKAQLRQQGKNLLPEKGNEVNEPKGKNPDEVICEDPIIDVNSNLRIDLINEITLLNGNFLRLSISERKALMFLSKYRNESVTYEELRLYIFGDGYTNGHVRELISRLKGKLQSSANVIHNIPGQGYTLLTCAIT